MSVAASLLAVLAATASAATAAPDSGSVALGCGALIDMHTHLTMRPEESVDLSEYYSRTDAEQDAIGRGPEQFREKAELAVATAT